jgi:hypothetical protein
MPSYSENRACVVSMRSRRPCQARRDGPHVTLACLAARILALRPRRRVPDVVCPRQETPAPSLALRPTHAIWRPRRPSARSQRICYEASNAVDVFSNIPVSFKSFLACSVLVEVVSITHSRPTLYEFLIMLYSSSWQLAPLLWSANCSMCPSGFSYFMFSIA